MKFDWGKEYKIVSGTGGMCYLQNGLVYNVRQEIIGEASDIDHAKETPDIIMAKAKEKEASMPKEKPKKVSSKKSFV